MIVTVKLEIFPHPKKEAERALVYAASKLTTSKESIKVEFSERDSEEVILQFWMPDKSYYKVVTDISEEVKTSCIEFYKDMVISFKNDRKRRPRRRRRKA